MYSVQIYNCSCIERRKKKDGSLYGDCKLFLSKDELEVVRVDCDIASIPLLGQMSHCLVRVSGLVPR